MSFPPTTLPGSALLLGFCLGLAGCSHAPPEAVALPPPVVTVSYLLERDVIDCNNFTGRTAAVEAVKVRARVWGYLNKINFREGALVRKDDVLFEIDPRTYQAAVDQAAARLTLAEAQLAQNASEAVRNTTLRAKGVVNQEDLDRSLTARATAAASVDSARADLKRAQLDLDFTRVKAPIAGQISRALVTVGNLVESGEMGGTLLTSIVSVDPMYVYFDVDDLTFTQVNRLTGEPAVDAAGSPVLPPVQLGLAAEQGYPHNGTINFVDNQVDPSTGTMRMRGVFPNKDRALTPGLFARVRVPLGGPHKALLVTDRAIDTDQGQKVVYVVNPDKVVEKRPVRLGRLHDGLREIEAGVKAGEQVIVDGIQRVRGGVTVEPKLVEMPSFQAARPTAVPAPKS